MGEPNELLPYLKVPNEAKALTELFVWSGKNGQAETFKTFVDSLDHGLQHGDWSSARKAGDELKEYIQFNDSMGKAAGALDILDKMGKVIEIYDAANDGDYLYAGSKLGAEVVDEVASKHLQTLGPGGIAIDYLTHEAGEQLSKYATEYQDIQAQEGQSQADFNASSVKVWQNLREWTENQVEEKLQAGHSPEDVQQWARDHMEAHGAVYSDLSNMEGLGDAQYGRLVSDQTWIVERTYEIWGNQDPGTRGPLDSPTQKPTPDWTPNPESPFLAEAWGNPLDEVVKHAREKAQELDGTLEGIFQDTLDLARNIPSSFTDAVNTIAGKVQDTIEQSGQTQTDLQEQTAESTTRHQDDRRETAPNNLNPPAETIKTTEPVHPVEPSVTDSSPVVAEPTQAQSSNIQPSEDMSAVKPLQVEVVLANEEDIEVQSVIEAASSQAEHGSVPYEIEIPLDQDTVVQTEEVTETDRLDALVSQMAREGANESDLSTEQLDRLVADMGTTDVPDSATVTEFHDAVEIYQAQSDSEYSDSEAEEANPSQ